jgi:hypothetical protein
MTPIICLLVFKFFLKYFIENLLKLICFNRILLDPFFKLNKIVFLKKNSKKSNINLLKKKKPRLFLNNLLFSLKNLNNFAVVKDFCKKKFFSFVFLFKIRFFYKKIICFWIGNKSSLFTFCFNFSNLKKKIKFSFKFVKIIYLKIGFWMLYINQSKMTF